MNCVSYLAQAPHGARAQEILRLASLGFDVRLQFSNVAELGAALTAGTPPIVFLDTGHLDYWSIDCPHVAVLVGMAADAFWLNDPFFDAAPPKASFAGFQQAWAANAFLAAIIRSRP
jgi:hypothetical protein